MKNNKLIIILLTIIILLLLAIIFLITTNKITFTPPKENSEVKESIEDKYQISYEEEEYITKRSNGTEVTKNYRNIPKITNNSNQEAANKIEKYLTDISNKEWESNIKKTADEVTESEIPYNDLGVSYFYQTLDITKNRLTFLIEMDGGFGGVSWISKEGYNFDAKTGDILTTNTITNNKDEFKKYILTKTNEKIDEINNNQDACLREDYQSSLEEEINKTGNWYFTEYDLVIVLQKYSVACGAAGIIEINLPKAEVNQYLKEEYKIP